MGTSGLGTGGMAGKAQDWSARGFARQAYQTVFGSFGSFLSLSAAWVGLLFLIVLIAAIFLESGTWSSAILFALVIYVSCAIAVGWHRRILLNDRRIGLAAVRFNMRQLKFSVYALFVFSGGYLLDPAVEAIAPDNSFWRVNGPVIVAFVSIINTYFLLRLILGFPLIAIDAPHPIKTAWRLSKGDVWLFFRVSLLTGVPLVLVPHLDWIFNDAVFGRAATPLAVIAGLLGYPIGICVAAAAFSFLLRAKIQPGGMDPPFFWP